MKNTQSASSGQSHPTPAQYRHKRQAHAVVVNEKNQAIIADHCDLARSIVDRTKGLLGRTSLSRGEGMLLSPCNNIHMWFMKIGIDVVFLSQVRPRPQGMNCVVSSVRRSIQPWKMLPVLDFRATDTLELPLGTIDRCNIQAGDTLCINWS